MKSGGIVEITLNAAVRGYIGCSRYRIHSMTDPSTQLVDRSGSINSPWFCLLDRQRLDQSRQLQTGSVPNIFPFHDAPPRDEGMHFGVDEACMSWRDTVGKYHSLEFTRIIRAVHRPLPMRGDEELVCKLRSNFTTSSSPRPGGGRTHLLPALVV